jgi:tetratricopeptide (TPR) repeat protein
MTRTRQGPGLFRVILAAVALLCTAGSMMSPAYAGKVMFGTQEHLIKIQDVAIEGPRGETLYLGYKYSLYSFVAPYSVSNDGYILGVAGQDRYYKLDAKMIEDLQAKGQLPNPLPPYQLSEVDYIFGNLLWIILAGLAIWFLISSLKDRRQKKAMPFVNDGLAHHRDGNLDLAIAGYSKALEIHPKFVDVLLRRGNAYRSAGDHDKAISDFSKILMIDNKNVHALLERGSAFESKGLIQLAIEDYSRAIKLGKTALTHFVRGNAYLGNRDFKLAVDDFSAAIKISPEFADAHQGRAAAYDKLGQHALAEADIKRAEDLAAQHQARGIAAAAS